jgi:hypothetical protein
MLFLNYRDSCNVGISVLVLSDFGTWDSACNELTVLFTDDLSDDAVRISRYTALNDKPINEKWIEKDLEGSGPGLIWGNV